jgi:hypothetical protein
MSCVIAIDQRGTGAKRSSRRQRRPQRFSRRIRRGLVQGCVRGCQGKEAAIDATQDAAALKVIAATQQRLDAAELKPSSALAKGRSGSALGAYDEVPQRRRRTGGRTATDPSRQLTFGNSAAIELPCQESTIAGGEAG